MVSPANVLGWGSGRTTERLLLRLDDISGMVLVGSHLRGRHVSTRAVRVLRASEGSVVGLLLLAGVNATAANKDDGDEDDADDSNNGQLTLALVGVNFVGLHGGGIINISAEGSSVPFAVAVSARDAGVSALVLIVPHVVGLLDVGSAVRTLVDSTGEGLMMLLEPLLRVLGDLRLLILLGLAAPEIRVGIPLNAVGLESDGAGRVLSVILIVDFFVVDPFGVMSSSVARRLMVWHIV